ncbi:hypothetical protein Nepgr_004165 [Nepenthes gracilis]|uniref:Uncharacterized protein n=1 Tax=Nepenthes gracilis TaxID=150966 RepID=A0AAD3XEZ6_NEPGR|nr:hypothetical protein Nepgr_004165 [Nepenthes gracilis]
MGRAPCCGKLGLKKGRWTAAEDEILTKYIQANGEGSWRSLPKNAGLLRCGKSCRLRWINYLRSDLKRGNISPEEEQIIIQLHSTLGNRWSLIAGQLGRTDNEIKNYWNSHLSRKIHFEKCMEGESYHQNMVTSTTTLIPPLKRRGGRTSRAIMIRNRNSMLKNLNKLIRIDASKDNNDYNNDNNSDNIAISCNHFNCGILPKELPSKRVTLSSTISSSRQKENKQEDPVTTRSPCQDSIKVREIEEGQPQKLMFAGLNKEVGVPQESGPMRLCYNGFMVGSDELDPRGVLTFNGDREGKEEVGMKQKGRMVNGGEDLDSGVAATNMSCTNSGCAGGESSDQWFSSSTTTSSYLDDGRLDWEWEGAGAVVGHLWSEDDQKGEMLSWLWDSDNIQH